MTVIFESGYTLPSGDEPLTHARIAHSLNWLSGGTAVASSTATGFFADGPLNSLTYELWKPSSVPATWEYNHGSITDDEDYCAIAAHTLGTNGNTAIFEAVVSVTNLIWPSEQIDVWSSTSDITVTANSTAAPDGNVTADTISKTGGTSRFTNRSTVATAGKTYTGSVYLKQGTAAETVIGLFSTRYTSLQTITIDWSNPGANTVNVGGGWYRASVTAAAIDEFMRFLIYPAGTGAANGTVYAWGAQVEEGTVASQYVATTTTTATANVSRTNLLPNSEAFGSWGASANITVTSNTIVAPDGNTTADTINKTGGTFSRVEEASDTTIVGKTYTGSVYLKQGTAAETTIRLYDSTTTILLAEVTLDWSNPTANAVAVGNDWYRISLSAAAVDAAIELLIYPAGYSAATGTVYAWGAQVEEGTVATGYIATTSAAASSIWQPLTNYTTFSTDDPIMAIFAPARRQRWRINITAGTAPTIGVFKVGKALQMSQPLYGGHSPINLARQTQLRSNYSETGEFLGRTKQRSILSNSFSWTHLKASWIRSNWPTLQKAIESEPFWIAWRPGDYGEVGYGQTDQVPIPQNMGLKDFMQVELSFRARAWD